MSALDISESRAAEFDKFEGTCLRVLQEYLDNKRPGGDDIVVARTGLANVAKNRQTITARDAMRFNMVSAITEDPKVLKRYIKATQPEIKKLITGT